MWMSGVFRNCIILVLTILLCLCCNVYISNVSRDIAPATQIHFFVFF